ncbi:MAG: acetyl-CoA C-acetyltransferase [Ruminococcaceae bacterium]|nr:acetyl-CoA C-acetyltransferase [Oscillospiraceae bacterium]
MKREVVIAGACRSPIGGFMGALSSVSAADLGSIVIREALSRAAVLPEQVEEVQFGCVLQAGAGQNIARQAAIKAGIPVEITATTINMVCGSGMKALIAAAQSILCGDRDIVVAGGTESMSQAPFYSQNMRTGSRLGDVKLVDAILTDGLTDVFNQYHMGITAENLAERHQITREEQDAFAAESQARTARAIKEGRFAKEIVPVTITDRKGNTTVISQDEHPRPDTTVEKLARLKPAFKKDGTVTAGNASGINDGAAALVLMDAARAAEMGIKPLARVIAYAEAGVSPDVMGIGPVGAVTKALGKSSKTLDDMDRIEANEAFAAQSIAVMRKLGLSPEKTNVNGGAIALGHPIGASGARIVVTLLYELVNSQLTSGLATLCIGGGMGSCMMIERMI